MTLLAVDSCGETLSAALLKPSGELSELGRGRGESSLAGVVAELLESAGVLPAEITHLVGGNGPGSFTGLRTGLAFLSGFAQTTGASVRVEGSFLGAARAAAAKSACTLVVAPAGRGVIFVGAYVWQDNSLREILAPQLSPLRNMCTVLDTLRNNTLRDRRQKFDEFSGLVTQSTPELAEWIVTQKINFSEPSRIASGLARLAIETRGRCDELFCKPTAETLATLRPEYLRSVQARTIAERSIVAPVTSDT